MDWIQFTRIWCLFFFNEEPLEGFLFYWTEIGSRCGEGSLTFSKNTEGGVSLGGLYPGHFRLMLCLVQTILISSQQLL